MFKSFFQNTRNPKGIKGKIMVLMMNKGHARLSKWGLSHITRKEKTDALDLGCGGGANMAVLLKMFPIGTVTGLDYSDISVARSTRLNRKKINRGRCKVLRGDVTKLPFSEDSFDLVTAFETVYFWPRLRVSFKQIYKALRPNGVFLICNEMSDPSDTSWTNVIDGMIVYSRRELEGYLRDAGFSRINADEKHGRLCLAAEK